ncbi:MAG: indolepyruvate ferredoxin oxidoreductase subunit alpha, partial [Zestosphaera sp.]
MSFKSIVSMSSGKYLLLGNEAIARGALEGGLGFAAAYPGTPSSEILESLISVKDIVGIYAEWSVNEKVAFEAAYGAS